MSSTYVNDTCHSATVELLRFGLLLLCKAGWRIGQSAMTGWCSTLHDDVLTT